MYFWLPLSLYILSSSMASASFDYVPTLDERLITSERFSNCYFCARLQLRTGLPQDYLRELCASDCMICLRGSLVCWAVSPLKRLQKIQAAAFKHFGIHAVTINEDTPRESTDLVTSCLFIVFYMCILILIYLIEGKYVPPKTACKCTHSSLLQIF